MSQTITVRRVGNTAVVYVNESGMPMVIRGFEDEPIGGFPLTCSINALPHRFPGCSFKFFEPPPQVESTETVSEVEIDAQLAKMALPGNKAHATVQVAPPPQATPATDLVVAFQKMAYEMAHGEVELSDLEAVGTFLVNLYPHLEEPLREAVARSNQKPAQKKRFTL